MKDDVFNSTLSPFGESSIKGFIKNNYGEELEAMFTLEKQKGYSEGRKEAIESLENDREILRAEVEKFQEEVALFNQRKNAIEEKERVATQRVEAFVAYIDNTEKVLATLREDARADITHAIANVYKSVYDTEARQHILLHGINEALDTLSEPSVEIDVSENCRVFIEQALTDTPGDSNALISSKVRINEALSDSQARIYTGGICIHVSTDKNRQIFKQNLLEAVNEI